MNTFIKRNWRASGLLIAMGAGILLPQLHALTFLVRYFIMIMLFFAFMNLDVKKGMVHRSHAVILAVTPLLGLAVYAGLVRFDADIALAGFLIVMTPTATASPVVAGLLGGNPAYPAFMVFASSLAYPLILSFALPLMLGGKQMSGLSEILAAILSTIIIPFVIARLITRFLPRVSAQFYKIKGISFPLWMIVLCVATAESSYFLRHSDASLPKVAGIAAAALVLCGIMFSLGRKIGGNKFAVEASQSFGQKNTIFTIWVALTFISPLVALGPAFYILCHNGWNAWQIHSCQRKELN